MHTTQLILDDWQYEALNAQAETEQRSIPDIIQEVIARHLAGYPVQTRHRLAEMEGIGTDSEAGGREHDRYLYGIR